MYTKIFIIQLFTHSSPVVLVLFLYGIKLDDLNQIKSLLLSHLERIQGLCSSYMILGNQTHDLGVAPPVEL